jgi:hypothetical protein
MNNWYSLEAYHISKLLAELPLQVCCLHLEMRTYENQRKVASFEVLPEV